MGSKIPLDQKNIRERGISFLTGSCIFDKKDTPDLFQDILLSGITCFPPSSGEHYRRERGDEIL